MHMLQRAHTHLDTSDAAVMITFFAFSRAFSIIQPQFLGGKMEKMEVDPSLVRWVLDYLHLRPPCVPTEQCL